MSYCFKDNNSSEDSTEELISPKDFYETKGCKYGWPNWYPHYHLYDYLKDDSYLDLLIRVRATAKTKPELNIVKLESNQNPVSTLYQDLYKLTENGMFSDVALVVDGQEYKVHRAILATRSEYFAALFDDKFKEGSESKITIENIQADDFKQILEFMYTDQLPFINQENASSLLMAADLLGLEMIAADCETYLIQCITVENCVEIYKLAYFCSRNILREKTEAVMKRNYNEVKALDVWKKLKEENITMYVGILEAIME